MPESVHFTSNELLSLAQELQTWAHQTVGSLGVQVWVADDMGLHPRAVLGQDSDDFHRQCARQCCLQNSPIVSGHSLTVPIDLTSPSSGACVFLLPGDVDSAMSDLFQAKVKSLSIRFDTAIQSERLERLSGLARKSDLLRSTLTLAHTLEHSSNLGETFAELHQSLKKLMYAENFFVVMLDDTRQNLIFEYYVDPFDDDTRPIPLREGCLRGSLSATVVAAGRVLRGTTRELLQRAGHVDTMHESGYDYGPNAADWLGVPMVVANEALGALVVQSYDPEISFNDSDPSMLSMVAEAIAVALHRRRMRAALEQTVAERTTQIEQTNRTLQETVSKLERAIGQLVHAEKLSSLGSMVAGISHELNGPIGTALTVTTSLEERLVRLSEQTASGKLTRHALDEFVTTGLGMIRLASNSASRAGTLVASFKQMAMDQTSESRRTFDVQQVTQDLLTALNSTLIRPKVIVTNAIAGGLVCDGYPGPLAQVIAHLVQNALTHAFNEDDTGTICIHAHTKQHHIVVSVTDDGIGMSPHEQVHAFDPFFTTKLGKGGSGIGLAVCHRIVSSVLGGEMKLQSASGKGASFSLEFPMIAPGRI